LEMAASDAAGARGVASVVAANNEATTRTGKASFECMKISSTSIR
jgi:hypothetical protein